MPGAPIGFSQCVIAVAALCAALAGCRGVEKRIAPSNSRDWMPEQAVLASAQIDGNRVTVRNVRNCRYFANDVYLVNHYDKSFDLRDVRGVDFIVVPFANMPAIAHTMLSFKILGPDGKPDYLAVSVETRKEKTEEYNAMKGSTRDYELMYVLADERDVIEYRTNISGEDVYLYETTATPEAARMLLADVLARVNQLAQKPEFYDTFTNNCTTNIVDHINRLRPDQVVNDVRAYLPGYSDELAYDEGLIVRRGTFQETKQQAYINPLAKQVAGREDFSERIRRR
jgi:hypothetical protein